MLCTPPQLLSSPLGLFPLLIPVEIHHLAALERRWGPAQRDGEKQLLGVPFVFGAVSASPAWAAESTETPTLGGTSRGSQLQLSLLSKAPAPVADPCIWRTPIPTNPHRSSAIPPRSALPIPPAHPQQPQKRGESLAFISLPKKCFSTSTPCSQIQRSSV